MVILLGSLFNFRTEMSLIDNCYKKVNWGEWVQMRSMDLLNNKNSKSFFLTIDEPNGGLFSFTYPTKLYQTTQVWQRIPFDWS